MAEIFEACRCLLDDLKPRLKQTTRAANDLTVTLSDSGYDYEVALNKWNVLSDKYFGVFSSAREQSGLDRRKIEEIDRGLRQAVEFQLGYEFAKQQANDARRPLDHRKLLDMLIDDIEEKYIELLEGTRAHTANIDGYVKTIATALDDDLNTGSDNLWTRKSG